MNNPISRSDPTGHDVGCTGKGASQCSDGYNDARESRDDIRTNTIKSPRFSSSDSYDRDPQGNLIDLSTAMEDPVAWAISLFAVVSDNLAPHTPSNTSNVDVDLYSTNKGTKTKYTGFTVTNESSQNVFLIDAKITKTDHQTFSKFSTLNDNFTFC